MTCAQEYSVKAPAQSGIFIAPSSLTKMLCTSFPFWNARRQVHSDPRGVADDASSSKESFFFDDFSFHVFLTRGSPLWRRLLFFELAFSKGGHVQLFFLSGPVVMPPHFIRVCFHAVQNVLLQAHDEKCGSCEGQLSALLDVVPLHAHTREEVWESAQDRRSARRIGLSDSGTSQLRSITHREKLLYVLRCTVKGVCTHGLCISRFLSEKVYST